MADPLLLTGLLLLLLTLVLLLFSRRSGLSELSELPALFHPPSAPPSASPHYLVVDIQTNGLGHHIHDAARPLQIGWIICDKRFRPLSAKVLMVRQKDLGSIEARQVHHITRGLNDRYGIEESEAIARFWHAAEGVPVVVAHNASFDLSILMHALLRRGMEREAELWADKQALCTMRYLSEGVLYDDTPYPSLFALTERLTGLSSLHYAHIEPVAWRNVCLTRACLQALKDKEGGATPSGGSSSPSPDTLLSVRDYLCMDPATVDQVD